MLVAHRPILHGCTDPGLQRRRNEDAHRLDSRLGLAILADGMGGSQAGDVAATLAVEGVHQRWVEHMARRPELLEEPLDEPRCAALEALLRSTVSEVNRDILHRARQDPACSGMGTTIIVAIWRGADLIIGHAGDSRAYRLRRSGAVLPHGRLAPPTVRLLTRDHVVMHAVADAARGSPWAAQQEERASHRLTRAVGVEEGLVLELHRHRLEPEDMILLCSDGLSDMVAEGQIERTVAQVLAASPAEAQEEQLAAICQALLDQALQAGGNDNITMILGQQGRGT